MMMQYIFAREMIPWRGFVRQRSAMFFSTYREVYRETRIHHTHS